VVTFSHHYILTTILSDPFVVPPTSISSTTIMPPRMNCWVGRRNAAVANECGHLKQVKGSREFSSEHQPRPFGGGELLSRPTPLVTSAYFDCDDTFKAIATAMLYRYEHEACSERDAINATLTTTEDKRSFLESLELRKVQIYNTMDEEDLELGTMTTGDCHSLSFIIQQTNNIFDRTLKEMWRASVLLENDPMRNVPLDSIEHHHHEHHVEVEEEEDENNALAFQKPPPSPKNSRHHRTPRSVSCPYSSQPFNNNTNHKNNTNNNPSESRGARRRRFFPDSFSEASHNKYRTRICFDWAKRVTATPVQSLQLDGMVSQPSLSPPRGAATATLTYEPPSPIVEASTLRRLY
jgi:hypothetical protein